MYRPFFHEFSISGCRFLKLSFENRIVFLGGHSLEGDGMIEVFGVLAGITASKIAMKMIPRALRNDVENRLHVGSRHRDDVENLSGDGLPLQRKLRLQIGVLGHCGLQLPLKLIDPAFSVHMPVISNSGSEARYEQASYYAGTSRGTWSGRPRRFGALPSGHRQQAPGLRLANAVMGPAPSKG